MFAISEAGDYQLWEVWLEDGSSNETPYCYALALTELDARQGGLEIALREQQQLRDANNRLLRAQRWYRDKGTYTLKNISASPVARNRLAVVL